MPSQEQRDMGTEALPEHVRVELANKKSIQELHEIWMQSKLAELEARYEDLKRKVSAAESAA